MVFTDRVEIWNSGSLPPELSVEDLRKPHTSFPANLLLTNTLYLADYIQRAGSGTLEMIKQCKVQGSPEPEFVLIRNVEFRTILPRDIYTENVLAKMGLNERQIKAIQYVKEKGKITNCEYRQLNNVSDEGARRDLETLLKKKIFRTQGRGRSLSYII
ncbi:MAG: ATP-binding protein [bacterium]